MSARSPLIPAMALVMLASCADNAPLRSGSAMWGLSRDRMSNTTIPINIAGGADSGLVAPRVDQAEGGALHVRVTLPDAVPGAPYRYMIYYRNDSYKFPENAPDGGQHALAHENFYGGFADGFHLSEAAGDQGSIIDDVLSIRSDPRNELPGARWARAPRVGLYSLLIVAVPEAALREHPPAEGVVDISRRDNGAFIEPYWYWLHGPGSARPEAIVFMVKDVVRIYMELDLSRGVLGCGNDSAHMASFIHHIDPASRFDNVPVVADMSTTAYTPAMFDSTMCFTQKSRLVPTLPSVAADPCKNLAVDMTDRSLKILNPAASQGQLRKENVGVRSRTALTYGRFRVHCQLAPLLNDSDLWNGLTNAIWLFGAGAEGVQRRSCGGGYFAYAGDGRPGRIDRSSYAEIDFEIMKGMPLCPERSFPPIYPQQVADPNDRSAWLRVLPVEVVRQRGNIAVACTNWDLACPDPPGFNIGCHDVVLDGTTFLAHRWDRDYRAVTEKSMEADDALFGPDGYWFEIDWRPDEIIWRIGTSPDKLRTVGYMNSGMTSVPEVPMWLVISQEFHNTTWWPGSPYDQAGVPFPAKDIEGRLFSVIVE